MTWSKRCDDCDRHPKVLHLSDRAYRLWNILLNYAAKYLTDGHIGDSALEEARAILRCTSRNLLARLAELSRKVDGFDTGLLEQDGENYRLHDFLDYHPTRAQVVAEREATRARKERWRKKHKNQR